MKRLWALGDCHHHHVGEMRFLGSRNLKLILTTILATLTLSCLFWPSCNKPSSVQRYEAAAAGPSFDSHGVERADGGGVQQRHVNQENGAKWADIDCVINDDYTVDCRREGQKVYLPFSFVEKYFEVTGKVVEYDGYERFELQQSYSKVSYPREPYDHNKIFMSFDHYNVEVRDRVKYISGVHGIPISTQWGPQGYFYPIQIAQYGLSHYSKNLSEAEPSVTLYEDAEKVRSPSRWLVSDRNCHINYVYDQEQRSRVLEFVTPEGSYHSPSVTLELGNTAAFVLTLDLKLFSNSTVTVVVDVAEGAGGTEKRYHLHYVSQRESLQRKGSHITYGVGGRRGWSRLCRNLQNDLNKGLGLNRGRAVKKTRAELRRVVKLGLTGYGCVDNVSLAGSAHLQQFFAAADWLAANQDAKGGWPISVSRTLETDMPVLKPGWYSAMAQGQAMSTLTRAYHLTGRRRYLDLALRATKPFHVPSSQGGVRAMFLDRVPWYEEYPTQPSSLVLNGFIYSLIGLYDLKMTCAQAGVDGSEAEDLYHEGIKSLKTLLPLYDTGSGTVYDLRHFTLGTGIAPKIARWDYHTTHISQLILLTQIDPDPLFRTTLDRWTGYLKGKRAKHN